jgi:hypothetical protein
VRDAENGAGDQAVTWNGDGDPERVGVDLVERAAGRLLGSAGGCRAGRAGGAAAWAWRLGLLRADARGGWFRR